MSITTRSSLLLFASIATTIILAELWIVKNLVLVEHGHLLSYGITIDVLLIIPLAYYFFIVRTGLISPKSLVVVFILLLGVLKLILPVSDQQHLKYILLIVPFVELMIFLWILSQLRSVVQTFRKVNQTQLYVMDSLEISLRKLVSVNKLFDSDVFVSILVGELSIIFYSITGWFSRYKVKTPDAIPFSGYRKKNYAAVVSVFVFMIIVETIVLHLILSRWIEAVSWVVTALSVYSLLWFMGDFHAIRLQPAVVTPTDLHLRTGVRWKTVISRENVLDLYPATDTLPAKDYVNLSVIGKPDWILSLRQATEVKGLFGTRKTARFIGLCVDDVTAFRQAILPLGAVE